MELSYAIGNTHYKDRVTVVNPELEEFRDRVRVRLGRWALCGGASELNSDIRTFRGPFSTVKERL